MARSPGSEPVCMRCGIARNLHAVDVRNMRWRFRARLCETCHDELMTRRARWMARPQPSPGNLRAVRLAAGLSLRALAERTGYSWSLIWQLEHGKIKSWDRYVERLTAAIHQP